MSDSRNQNSLKENRVSDPSYTTLTPPVTSKFIVIYRNASQECLESAPIFKGRTRSIPRSLWQTLTVRTEGQELSSMLEDWGASDILSNPVTRALISARDTTGPITGSRFVLRALF